MACRQPNRAAGALRVAKAMGAALVGLAAAIAGFGAPGGRASASQLGTAKAQVAALQAQVLSVARQVHTWTVRYDGDLASAARSRQEALLSQAALVALRAHLASTRSLLQQEALLAYVNVLPSIGDVEPGRGDVVAELDRETYQKVAVGEVTGTISQYRQQESAIAAELAACEQRLGASLAALRAAAEARNRALTQAAALQSLLDQARVHLARLQAIRAAAIGLPVGNGIVKAVADQLSGITQAPADPSASPPTTAVAPTTTTLPPTTTMLPPTTTTAAPTTTATLPPTTTTAAPSTTVTITAAAAAGDESRPGPLGGVWAELRECESGDNYQADTGNGYYGAYQFSWSTWDALGYSGRPDLEPYWLQDEAAVQLQAEEGWGQWPACSAALGL